MTKLKIMEYEKIKNEFQQADIEGKIEMYVSTEGLTQEQYRDLLQFFPISELSRLESALDEN